MEPNREVPIGEHDRKDNGTISPDVTKAVDRGVFGSLGRFIHKLSHSEAPSEADGDLSNEVLKAKADDLGARMNKDAKDSLPPQPQQRDE